jgi:acyl-CoA thioester hydrolase
MTIFHSYFVRVYQEDVDGGGIIYHANYFKYAERARTEWLRGYGLTQSGFISQEKCSFVVTNLNADYCKPAFLDDELEVRTGPIHAQGIRLIVPQKIYRQNMLCVDIKVSLALINNQGKPIRLPQPIIKIIGK